MAIKATFPAGVSEITVNGLTQWDYGQTLEIMASDLPDLVEVHFACPGMNEAVVRVCSNTGSRVKASIPDECLAQTAPILAWIYAVEDTSGTTIKTIKLPIIPRTRPQTSASIPPEISDKYTELIGEVNQSLTNAVTLVNSMVDTVNNTMANTVTTVDEHMAEELNRLETGEKVAKKANEAKLLTPDAGYTFAGMDVFGRWRTNALYLISWKQQGGLVVHTDLLHIREGDEPFSSVGGAFDAYDAGAGRATVEADPAKNIDPDATLCFELARGLTASGV